MSRLAEAYLPDTYALDKLTRRNDPQTSRLAAASVLPHLTNLQERVLVYFRNSPQGSTDLSMQEYFEDDSSTLRTRRAELVTMGRLKNSGRTIKQAGSRRTIWIFVR